MRRNERTRILVLLMMIAGAALVLVAQNPGETAKQEPPASAGSNAAVGQPSSLTDESGNYVIGAMDILDISVWKEPEISRRVPVRPDGKISLPLLNDIEAAGLTPMRLQERITEGLKKFVTAPQVTVTVLEINSKRIFVLGEVARKGALPMLPNMTVLQAISSAGGFGQFANTKKIYVMRNENGKQVTFPFNYNEVIKGNRPEQNFILKPGDTIVVP